MDAPKAGYSGKTLAQKLGIAPNSRVAAIDAPAHYEALLGEAAGFTVVRLGPRPKRSATFGIVHLFAARRAALEKNVAGALACVAAGGALWISWPKKSSPQFIDLTEDVLREVVLPTGFVDVKVCAVDENWSGLKFMKRRVPAKPAR